MAYRLIVFWLAALAGATTTSAAQAESPTALGTRHALMVCGLTGDAAHRQLLGQTLETIYASLTSNHSFSADHITVLWSEAKKPEDGPALTASVRPATREALAESVAKIQQALQPQDALWVFVLGHAHYDGKVSWLNLPGPDMNQAEFAALFAATNNQEQLFFMTTAASGFFIKPLSKPGRIIISATEADREVNETLFPHKLAAALAEPPPFAELDHDEDGRLSLLDIYLHVARQTAQDYADNELLARSTLSSTTTATAGARSCRSIFFRKSSVAGKAVGSRPTFMAIKKELWPAN